MPPSAGSTPAGAVAVDVLVIGGGLQGLLLLDRLAAGGFSCALVTPTDLGTGQTLHSHGVLNTGFGMAGTEPVRLLREVVLPDLARRGVRCDGEWLAITPPGSPVGDAVMSPPPGLDVRGGGLHRLPEVNVDRRELLSAMAHGVEDRIVRGSVSAVERRADGHVVAVEVAREDMHQSIVFAPATIVVAAGTGSKALLRRLGAGEAELAPIKHRLVHVLCVRGADTALPAINVLSVVDGLFIASHRRDGVTTWLATPVQLDAASVDDVPDDASAEVDDAVVERGWELMGRLYPPLRSLPGLRFASYAGFRQDVGDTPGVPMCARMAAVPNVIAGLPSGLLGAWLVAARAVALVREGSGPRRPQPAIPATGVAVAVGSVHEDGIGLTWTAEHGDGGLRLRYTTAGARGRP